MTKTDFLNRMSSELNTIKHSERKRILLYYSELIDDMIENGMTEEAAILSLGNIDEITIQIFEEAEQQNNIKKKLSPTYIALIVMSSPIWLSLLIAVFSVVLAFFVSLIAVTLGIELSGIAMFIVGLILIPKNIVVALSTIGLGLILTGIGLLLTVPVYKLIKLCVKSIIKLFSKLF